MQSSDSTSTSKNTMLKVLSQRDFRLLWIGQGTSLLGDQFALIALPWLVLTLSKDPLALGLVLALAGVPRLVCMLVGGAVVDRLSPRLIMLASDLARLVLWGLLTVLVLTGAIQLWMLYVLTLGFGIASGFFIPASSSVIPRLVPRQDLQAGNSIIQATTQLMQSVGPALAGTLIAAFTHTQNPDAAPTLTGIAIAFGMDTLTFIVSIVTLWLMTPQAAQAGTNTEKVFHAISSGFEFFWKDAFFRTGFMTIALVNLIFIGPLYVGVPVLASTRLVEGAAAYGIVMSSYAVGNLAGILGAGSQSRLSGRGFRNLLLGLFSGFGICLASFGWIHSTWIVAAMLLFLGAGNGYLAVSMITLFQRRTPMKMMGRLMSLLMVANLGLAPISQTLTGLLSRWSLTGLFALAGAAMLLMAVTTLFQPQFRSDVISRELAHQPAAD